MTEIEPLDNVMDDLGQPGWVLVGCRFRGQPAILASRELTGAELRAELLNLDEVRAGNLLGPIRRPLVYEYTVAVTMARFTLVVGTTYAEAFAELLRQWNPDETAGVLALAGGPEEQRS